MSKLKRMGLDDYGSTIIAGKLYLGSKYDVQDYEFILKNKITSALNVSHRRVETVEGLNHVLHTPLVDGEGNEYFEFKLAVDALRDLMKSNEVILLHCLAGVSRSPAVLAACLAIEWEISVDAALNIITGLRKKVNPKKVLVDLAKKYVDDYNASMNEEMDE